METTQTVRVGLGERSYDIIIGPALLEHAERYILPVLKQKRAILITDSNVAGTPLLPQLRTALSRAGVRLDTLVIPAGEGSKSLAQYGTLMEHILVLNPERKTTLIALGGGVIGDLVGFAASSLLRGVPFIQIPTTLLSQVDSSVGGKTGINSQHGKNLIGAFYQPQLVLADTQSLATLPDREMRSGYAEVVKYGLINDPAFFEWLEINAPAVLKRDTAALIHAIRTSCEHKARIVAEDEREGGVRALLNLGHTFGHAYEAETGYGSELLHGEAVAVGMHLAFRLSANLQLCPTDAAARVSRHLKTLGLPASPYEIRPDWDIDALIAHMGQDKKVEDGTLTFILARDIGKSFISRDVRHDALRKVLEERP